MKKSNLANTCVLPKVSGVSVSQDFVCSSDGTFAVSLSWITGIQAAPKGLRFVGFRNKVLKFVAAKIAVKLMGETHDPLKDKLANLVAEYSSPSRYSPCAKPLAFKGYVKGEKKKRDVVGFKIGEARLSASMASICFLDPETKIYFRASTDPVIIKKNNKPVAFLAPLNPEKLEGK